MAIDPGRAVTRTERGGALATDAPGNPWATAGLLKPYAGGAVYEAPKVDALATISAGYKNADGFPVVSRDGTIYVRSGDRAPGLIAELGRRGNKSLTIALVHNDPKDVLQQWFATYSKTRLEARGDADEITLIHLRDTGRKNRRNEPVLEPERETIRRADNPKRFAMLAASMKVQTSLYFALAEWDGAEPRLIFPDGLGLYRLAFASLNSAEAIKSQLSYIASLTGGRVAGVPLELSIAYRNLAGPDGVRRDRVPIFSLVLQPPETIKLSPSMVASILQSGIEQAQQLAIAAPRPETLELAEYEGPDVDLDDTRVIDGEARPITQQDAHRLAGGGPIRNSKGFTTSFMMMVSGSSLEDKPNRQTFMLAHTRGRYDSLKTFAENASHEEGNALVQAAADWLNQERSESPAPPVRQEAPPTTGRSYEDLFDDDDEGAAPEPKAADPRPRHPATRINRGVHAAAQMTGAPPMSARSQAPTPTPAPDPEPTASPTLTLPEEPDWLRTGDRKLVLASWDAWAAALRRLDSKYEIPDPQKLANPRLVERLQEIVSYARHTWDSIYGDDDATEEVDDDETTRQLDEEAEALDQALAADEPAEQPEPAPAF